MLCIPKVNNPSFDTTGRHCSVGQTEPKVWFLTGTFGNTRLVERKCTVASRYSLFFPVLEKEDSFTEDSDLNDEAQLIDRCVNAMNRVIRMEACIDGQVVRHLENFRVCSHVFDLTFPLDNVYGVSPGKTRSICDGYWLFIKPLKIGQHRIHFKGEVVLLEGDPVQSS